MPKFQVPHDLSGKRGLAAAIIALAYNDLTSRDPAVRQDAERFFESGYCRSICQAFDLPEYSLQEVLSMDENIRKYPPQGQDYRSATC